MSYRPCHAGHMKIKKALPSPTHHLRFQATTLARFGPARLVRKPDGHHELIGGTAEYHAAAREWCSLFAPGVEFSAKPQQNPIAFLPPEILPLASVSQSSDTRNGYGSDFHQEQNRVAHNCLQFGTEN